MNQAQMVSRFYDARDGAKAIMGDSYLARIQTIKTILEAAVSKHKCSIIKAFLIINQENRLDGWEKVLFMAAVCEIYEDDYRAPTQD
jgi:hypothetical protein